MLYAKRILHKPLYFKEKQFPNSLFQGFSHGPFALRVLPAFVTM